LDRRNEIFKCHFYLWIFVLIWLYISTTMKRSSSHNLFVQPLQISLESNVFPLDATYLRQHLVISFTSRSFYFHTLPFIF